MGKKKRILLDVDGPLTASFARVVCRYLRALGVAKARYEDISQWDIMASFGVEEKVAEEAYESMRRFGVAAEFEPREGARDFVEWLRGRAEVYAVTAPLGGSPTWAYDRGLWLADELGFDAKHVVNADDKSVVDGDALLEDRAKNLLGWKAAHPAGLALLWDASYNEEDRGDFTRVHDYADVVNELIHRGIVTP